MFTYWSCSDGKGMYKKACYTRKVVVLPCQPIPFSTFSLSSPSLTKRHCENEQTILPVSCLAHFAQVTVCSWFAGKYRGKRKMAHGVTVK